MRDQLVAAVTARLDRIAAAQDVALALEPGALENAQRLVRVLHDDDVDLETYYVLGWYHWYQYLALPEGQDHDALREATRALTPCFIATTNAHTATKANVLAHLGGCAIAHFACHGSSYPVDPSQSLLLLHDYDSDPFTVANLAPIRLDQARLAYLSACRTAFNPSTDLIDEAIHLTTAFQLAGYPHVVGTLWEIGDALAVQVADAFYTALVTGDNMIDTRGAAQALHHAVRAIRDELPATPSLWAAYLHAGA